MIFDRSIRGLSFFLLSRGSTEGEKEGEEEEGSFASRRMITIDPIPNRFFSFCEIRDLFLFQFYDP